MNMSLIKCPECGKEVEDSLDICDNCGFPFDGTEKELISDVIEEKIPKSEEVDFSKKKDNRTEHQNDPMINVMHQTSNENKKISSHRRIIRNILLFVGGICFIIGCYFTMVGFDKKNTYYNSKYSFLDENVYVGGDAYNYIINGTYFMGYLTLASGMFITAGITTTAGLYFMLEEEKGMQ